LAKLADRPQLPAAALAGAGSGLRVESSAGGTEERGVLIRIGGAVIDRVFVFVEDGRSVAQSKPGGLFGSASGCEDVCASAPLEGPN
jgi:hypothetical protein